jgi:hypothetical protein
MTPDQERARADLATALHEAIFDYAYTPSWPILGDDFPAAEWLANHVLAAREPVAGPRMTPAQALLHQVTLDPAWPTLHPDLREAIGEELEGVIPANVTSWGTPPTPCRDRTTHPRHLVPGTGA